MKQWAKATSTRKAVKQCPFVPFSYSYHTKQLNPWPNSSASRIVNYSPLSSRLGEMEPFEDDLSTRGHLTSLRNRPQQKQPR